MISVRLKKIADMIPEGSRVIDIGCDHALLDIYLTLNKNCRCIAVDVNNSCLDKARDNIMMYSLTDRIDVVLSNGFDNVKVQKSDYVVIAGMGTVNILKILDGYDVDNIIIQTNKDLEFLRRELSKKYTILEETVILDKKVYYIITKFTLKKSKLSFSDIVLGKYIKNDVNYIDYRKYLLDKYVKIRSGLPKRYVLKRLNLLKRIIVIKKYC